DRPHHPTVGRDPHADQLSDGRAVLVARRLKRAGTACADYSANTILRGEDGGYPMSILFVLVPLALLLATLSVGAFLWAVQVGQFDDLETPALRALFDEERAPARPPKDA